jgi:hypothetical protein
MKSVVGYVTACHGYRELKGYVLTRQHRTTQLKPSVSLDHQSQALQPDHALTFKMDHSMAAGHKE